MRKQTINYLDFEVDKLTRSIENVVTGDSFPTEILHLTKSDLKSMTKKNGWKFDWLKELNSNSKSKIIDHYEKTLGATHFGGQLMIINTNAAKHLVDKYFKS